MKVYVVIERNFKDSQIAFTRLSRVTSTWFGAVRYVWEDSMIWGVKPMRLCTAVYLGGDHLSPDGAKVFYEYTIQCKEVDEYQYVSKSIVNS